LRGFPPGGGKAHKKEAMPRIASFQEKMTGS